MSKVKLTVLFSACLLALGTGKSAGAEEEKPQTYAVLIGISSYGDAQIKARPNAERDATALYDVFTDKAYMGIPADHVRLLLGKPDAKRQSQPATHDNMIKALKWVAENAKKNDMVLFAFIGQGASLGTQGNRLCYLASDSTLADRAKNAVAAADIQQELDKLKAEKFAAFLDVNFRGHTDKPVEIPDPSGATVYREFLGGDTMKEEGGPAIGRALFLANGGMRQSVNMENQGLFAHLVVAGLKGAADKEGYQADGVITVDELGDYIEKECPELAQKYGKTDEEKRQLCRVYESRQSHYVLVKNPAVTAQVEERLKKFDQLATEKKVSPELALEGRKLLKQMPKLKAQQELRKLYQNLVDGKIAMAEFEKDRTANLAGMKLKRSDAFSFASNVMEATRILHDNYVKEVNQGEMVAWAIRGLYKALEESIPEELLDRLTKVKDASEGDLQALLAEARDSLGQREDLDNHKDLDIALQRMCTHLDPHTTYIDKDTVARFDGETQGKFKGIGIVIHANGPGQQLEVVTPIKGSPAYRKGIKAGDLIVKIIREVDKEGKPLAKPEETLTKGMTTSDAVKLIQGAPGTKVKLVIQRKGVDKPIDIEVQRAIVEVETVMGAKRKENDEWDYYIDPTDKIAYVRVTTFARKTSADVYKVLKQLQKSGINGFILDLRNNPGGLLTSAVEISDMFIDDGLIVSIRSRTDKEYPYIGKHDESFLNFPMVCLVDNRSASGSEIVSACLQDHKRAVVMGQRSFGKGSVQTIQPFKGGELKMTTASFWRPNGKNLNKSSTTGKDDEDWGVTPNKGFSLNLPEREKESLYEAQHDAEIIQRRDLPQEKKPDFKDRQLNTAIEYLRGQIKLAAKYADKKAG